jgi:N6-adenosine-specific RNA methylase IME4
MHPKLYDVIYADPPWTYDQRGVQGAAAKQYPLMTDDELCAMKIPAAKDCILYLWATSPLLESGLRVLQAWGFSYKSQAIWDKMRTGIGFWWIGQHEILMVGVRGDVKPPPPELWRSSVIRCPRGRHSSKPDQVRDWISAWYPEAKRLEMFSRLKRPGWDVFGNQVEIDLLSDLTPAPVLSPPEP